MARHKQRFMLPIPPKRSCGKNRYESEGEAELVAREVELRDLTRQLKLKVYHCSFCGGWHLTSHTML